MMIEDDTKWDDDDEDAQAIMVMTALTASCIVMKEHIDKDRRRKKGVVHLQFPGKECLYF